MTTETLTQDQNGQHHFLGVGDIFSIQLDGNLTTGYTWELDDVDQSQIELISNEYIPRASNAIGSGGVHSFTFRAKKAGTFPVKLKYWQPWEGDASIGKRFEVIIHAESR